MTNFTLKALNWSEAAPPKDGVCNYDHKIAHTEFGRFLLTWKSWKGSPDYYFDETPWGDCEYEEFHSIKEATDWAQAEFTRRIANTLVAV